MKREVYELQPDSYDGRKSFNGKAHVEIVGNTRALKSYETIVAAVNEAGEVFRIWSGWSATTARHVNSFVRSETGKAGISKAEWQKMPVYNWSWFSGKITPASK
jgi:hypothetical protein